MADRSSLEVAKVEAAIGNRILAEVGLASGVRASLGHVSMRVPGDPNLFVVKGRGYRPVAVGVGHGAFDLVAVEHLPADDRDPPVNPHHFRNARDEKGKADMGIVVHVQVGLKVPVAGHVGDQEVLVIQDADEAGHAPLGRGITAALAVAGGHHQEGGLRNESFDRLR